MPIYDQSGGGGGGLTTGQVDARIAVRVPVTETSPSAIQDVAPATPNIAPATKVTKVLSDGTTEYWEGNGTTWTKVAVSEGIQATNAPEPPITDITNVSERTDTAKIYRLAGQIHWFENGTWT